MSDTLPPRPAPIPPPDRYQIERLNDLYDLSAVAPQESWRGRAVDRLRMFLVRILHRQQEFNAAVVDHLNRNALVGIEAHHASSGTIAWVEDTVQSALDEMRRHQQALGAWEQRSTAAVTALASSHEELRTSLGILQQAAHTLKREVARLGETGVAASPAAGAAATSPGPLESLDSAAYVGFEDQFRGSTDDIRQRVSEYLPFFQGAHDVLDIGCGRGEFLALLREQGIQARGIDINASMVDVCRQQSLDAIETDALSYSSGATGPFTGWTVRGPGGRTPRTALSHGTPQRCLRQAASRGTDDSRNHQPGVLVCVF